MPGPEIGYVASARLPSNRSNFDDVLATAAGELSRTLAPSLEEIWMFKYEDDMVWLVFVVTRTGSLDGEPHMGVVQQDLRPYIY